MEDLIKVLILVMNEQQYGVNISQVRSIERLQGVTKVPRTSDFIKGIISLRDEIIPIIDLKEQLLLGEKVETTETRIIIVRLSSVQVGLIVDAATDVIDIDPTEIEPAPKLIENMKTKYLSGMTKLTDGLLLLLNIESLFSHDEMDEVEKVIEQ